MKIHYNSVFIKLFGIDKIIYRARVHQTPTITSKLHPTVMQYQWELGIYFYSDMTSSNAL